MNTDSDWITDSDEQIKKNNNKNITLMGLLSLILAISSLGIIFAIFARSWLLVILLGPIGWSLAIVLGAIAVMRNDKYGAIGATLAYLIFLGFMLLLFH